MLVLDSAALSLLLPSDTPGVMSAGEGDVRGVVTCA